jgi:hypothetical protein
MKDFFSKAVKLSNTIFGEGSPDVQKAGAPKPEKKEWDFGTMQAKVKIENGQFTWSLTGNGGSSYPLSSVRGIQYEKGPSLALLSHFVVLASGGDNKRVKIPRSDKSEKIVASINQFLNEFHEKGQATKPTAATSSTADELAKLAALKQQGILTEDEFQQQKQKLLNG